MALRSPWGRITPILKGKKLNLDEKRYIAYQINTLNKTPTELSTAYQIGRKVISKYANFVSEGLTLHNTGGAPVKFDLVSREIITAKLGGEKRIQKSEEETKVIYKEEQAATASRRNQSGSQQRSPDKRTIVKLEADLGIRTLVAEETTDAREMACANVRNTVSTMAQFNSSSKLAPHAALQNNFDSTTLQVGDKALNPKRKAKIIGNVHLLKSVKVKKGKSQGITAYFAKVYTIMNAKGSYGPLVYCIADANMDEADLDWHVIPPGVFGINQHDEAHVVIAKTRAMGDTFCEKYWTGIVVPFVQEERTRYGLDGQMASVNCDGESAQIDVFTKPKVYDMIKAANIMVDKPSGSTTEITQACDQLIYKEMKKENKKFDDSDVDINSPEFKCITAILADHQNTVGKAMSTAHVRQAAFGLVRARMAAQNALTGPRATKSFKDIGQYPFNKEKVIRQCTTKLSAQQEKTIFDALPKLTSQYDAFGELVQKDFDDAKIFNNDIPGKKLKEDSATNRKRSCRLTHHIQHDQMLAKEPVREEAREKRVEAKKRKAEGSVAFKPYQPQKKRVKVT